VEKERDKRLRVRDKGGGVRLSRFKKKLHKSQTEQQEKTGETKSITL